MVGPTTVNNGGDINVSSTGSTTDLAISGQVSLFNGGNVNMGNNSNNRIVGTSSTSVLTNIDNLIHGSGQIGVNTMGVRNSGSIIADQPTSLVIDPSTSAAQIANPG